MNLLQLYIFLLGIGFLLSCGSSSPPFDRSPLSDEYSATISEQSTRTIKPEERSAPKEINLKRVAIIQLKSRAELSESDILFLTDTMRQAGALLDPSRFTLMTRENMSTLLPTDSDLEGCEVSCEIQLGRMIGAHYIITGELVRFGDALRAQLRLHNSESGAILSSISAKSKQIGVFELSLGEATIKLLSTIDEGMKEKTFPRPVEVSSATPQTKAPQAGPITLSPKASTTRRAALQVLFGTWVVDVERFKDYKAIKDLNPNERERAVSLARKVKLTLTENTIPPAA